MNNEKEWLLTLQKIDRHAGSSIEDQKKFAITLRSLLQYGDQRIIAKVVGCSPETVKKVLSGERRYRKGKGAKVIQATLSVIARHKIMKAFLAKD